MEPLDPSDTEKYATLFHIEEAHREAALQSLQLLRAGKEPMVIKPANGFRFTPGMPPDTVSAIMDHGRFIKRLLKVWDAHPELTFGQLLMNAFTMMKRYPEFMTTGNIAVAVIGNIVSESDDELVKDLEQYYSRPAESQHTP